MKKFSFIILFLANLTLLAQNKNSWKYVSKEDFAINDENAPAVVISENSRYYFDVWNEELKLYHLVTRKIKILNKDGLKYANIIIRYYGEDHFEDVIYIKGIDYKLTNGKIKNVKLKQKDIEKNRTDDFYEERVRFPELEVGDVVVIQYLTASLNMLSPPVWNFQKDEIPTLKSTAEINLPDFISYKIKINGKQYNLTQQTENSDMTLSYIVHYRDPIPLEGGHRAGYEGTMQFYFQTINYVFSMQDIPPLQKEQLVDCYCNYRSSLSLDLYKVDKNTYLTDYFHIFFWSLLTRPLYLATLYNTRYYNTIENSITTVDVPAGFILYNAGNWTKTDKGLLNSKDFYQIIIRNWNYKEYLDSALQGKTNANELEKMKAIYNYINQNIVWNSQEGIFAKKYPEQTIEDGIGSAADINFLLISLLQKAGIEAYPVLIKTIDRGHVDKELATYRQFNLTIAAVIINNKTYLLDATGLYTPWGLLPLRDLNGTGRLISPKECKFIDIKPNITSLKRQTAMINLNNSFVVKNNILKGYPAYEFDSKSEKNIVNFTDTIPLDSIKKGNKIYPFDLFGIHNYFLPPQRNLPIYLAYPENDEYTVIIQLTDNQKVASLPKNFTATTNGYLASGTVSQNGSQIVMSLKINRTKDFFEMSEYPNLRNIWLQIQDFLDTPIVIE